MSVNVHTEWAPLKEIIVGSCANFADYEFDPSFRLFFHENVKDPLVKHSAALQQKIVEQRQEDLDGLADTLKKMGIVVHRPRTLPKIEKFKTPAFEDWLCPMHNPRDRVLIAGNEIIESSCQVRRRYFETALLRDVFLDYFRKGARWTEAPRPTMELNSFDLAALPAGDPSIPWHKYENDPNRFEIMFDAAQCFKFGRDIVINVSNRNHELGAIWLKRHLGDRFRVHVVRITAYHIDGMFMPLRPGVLLLNHLSMSEKIHLLPEPLQKWDMLVVPEEHRESPDSQGLRLASRNINVNVLPISPREVLVFNEVGTPGMAMIRLLERNGFTPIPVRLRHCRLFDGGLHCATLDTVREDSAEDYFYG